MAVVVILALAGGYVAWKKPFAGATTYTNVELGQRWQPSTLFVETKIAGQVYESGTGWVYNAALGLVVTNAHVVTTPPPVLQGFGSSPATTYSVGRGSAQQPATLLGVSICDDLAVLQVKNTAGLQTFHLGTQSDVQDGENVVALGYPADAQQRPGFTLSTGVVSDRQTALTNEELQGGTPAYPNLIQTTATINPGNSGGPLLDTEGRLIGVNTAGITQENGRVIQGEYYAIGVDKVRQVIPKLASGHSIGYTGLNFLVPGSTQDFQNFGLQPVDGGLIVPTAQIGSPAYRAGFGHGQALVIVAINGKPIDTLHSLGDPFGTFNGYCNAVGAMTTGDVATFTVESQSGTKTTMKVGFS